MSLDAPYIRCDLRQRTKFAGNSAGHIAWLEAEGPTKIKDVRICGSVVDHEKWSSDG